MTRNLLLAVLAFAVLAVAMAGAAVSLVRGRRPALLAPRTPALA
jgi:hypothetical protein